MRTPLFRLREILLLTTLGLASVMLGMVTTAQANPDGLQPGEFSWMPELAPSGPLAIIVSLPLQRAYVYRNGVRIGTSTVSTGKAGYDTPGGIYTVLQKHREHYSNRYDNAPMPFMQRLTWDGLALHAGGLPGYPASHGCVRLPGKFAEQLFAATAPGTVVVIAAGEASPPAVVSPGWFSPVDAGTGSVLAESPLQAAWEWFPERSAEGPLAILLSTHDKRLIVLRNAIEIGRSDLAVTGEPITGTNAFVLLEGIEPRQSLVVPDRPALRWLSLASPSQMGPSVKLQQALESGHLVIPQDFARLVYDVLRPGTTVIVTDEPLQSAVGVTVLTSDDSTPPD